MNFNGNKSEGIETQRGFDYVATATGVFASGTMTLEASIDGGQTWFTPKDINGLPLAILESGGGEFTAPGNRARWTMTGVSETAFVKAEIFAK